MLQIYNTLARKKEEFKPIKDKEIGLYVCGITVYDHCHVGHARTFLVFDMVVRYLRFQGFKVNFIRNITDIDDKIIKKSQENNTTCDVITTKYIASMWDDFKALNMLSPNKEPKATEFIPKMISLIKQLEANGFAYVGDNGDVFYEVRKNKNYGKLSGRNIDDLQVGSRVEVNDAKRDPLDFVLWKKSKTNEPAWESPWGLGRPGWHIECSAMSLNLLGETFDIHGGGFDLIFPHHENECAQAEMATNKKFVNTWMHVGFLQINQEKMSKSLGNFYTIKQVLETYSPEVLRYFMLSAHYRSHHDYSVAQLDLAKSALTRLYTAIKDLNLDKIDVLNTIDTIDFANANANANAKNIKIQTNAQSNKQVINESTNKSTIESIFYSKFINAMDDDFNTPEALAVLFELAREINIKKEQGLIEDATKLGNILLKLAFCLGLLYQDPEQFLQGFNPYKKEQDSLDAKQIDALIVKRNLARTNKDWKLSDAIRDELKSNGIVLEDSGDTTTWRRL